MSYSKPMGSFSCSGPSSHTGLDSKRARRRMKALLSLPLRGCAACAALPCGPVGTVWSSKRAVAVAEKAHSMSVMTGCGGGDAARAGFATFSGEDGASGFLDTSESTLAATPRSTAAACCTRCWCDQGFSGSRTGFSGCSAGFSGGSAGFSACTDFSACTGFSGCARSLGCNCIVMLARTALRPNSSQTAIRSAAFPRVTPRTSQVVAHSRRSLSSSARASLSTSRLTASEEGRYCARPFAP
mmetsp:Transcript_96558/g.273057  ORF Transcript_96558/g.273057 Transcript_96558/m.273057 type:complete len:242 (+) Transcript_96558:624-1349(+)